MSGLLEAVITNVRSRKLLSRSQRVLVAVSGGVDSMVLLYILHVMAAKHKWRLTIAHLNHKLRGRSSQADERLVRQTAKNLKLPIVVEIADVRQFSRAHRVSLEMAARKLRHDFLARTAARLRIPAVALAHHADDQLELFFLRLFRGSGSEGLSGMKWVNPSPADPGISLVRPLLDQPKSALLVYAATNKIRYREDATNASLDIQRNRIRHQLLPLLRKKYQPALDKTILRVMDIIGAEADFVADAAVRLNPNSAVESRRSPSDLPVRHQPSPSGRGRTVARSSARPRLREVRELDVLPFDKLPVALQRRCLHVQLINHSIAPSYDLIEELRLHPDQPVSVREKAADGGDRDFGSNSLKGHAFRSRALISRDAAGLVQVRESTHSNFSTLSLPVPLDGKSGGFDFNGTHFTWRLVPGKFLGMPERQAGEEVFDADGIGDQILLRHWQPGDRFQPIGMKSAVKLQDLFTNAKFTKVQRHRLAVALAADGGIFWVEGLRISERYKLKKSTIRRLHWRWRSL